MDSAPRPPKRRLSEVETLAAPSAAAAASGGAALVGRYIERPPPSRLLGKITSYAAGAGYFRVVYDNGEIEDLEHDEVSGIVLGNDAGSGMKMSIRKRKLDQLAITVGLMEPPPTVAPITNMEPEVAETPARTRRKKASEAVISQTEPEAAETPPTTEKENAAEPQTEPEVSVKPARTRRKKASEGVITQTEPQAAETPARTEETNVAEPQTEPEVSEKPSRTRKKKASEGVITHTEPEAAETPEETNAAEPQMEPEVSEKPARTRKKKASEGVIPQTEPEAAETPATTEKENAAEPQTEPEVSEKPSRSRKKKASEGVITQMEPEAAETPATTKKENAAEPQTEPDVSEKPARTRKKKGSEGVITQTEPEAVETPARTEETNAAEPQTEPEVSEKPARTRRKKAGEGVSEPPTGEVKLSAKARRKNATEGVPELPTGEVKLSAKARRKNATEGVLELPTGEVKLSAKARRKKAGEGVAEPPTGEVKLSAKARRKNAAQGVPEQSAGEVEVSETPAGTRRKKASEGASEARTRSRKKEPVVKDALERRKSARKKAAVVLDAPPEVLEVPVDADVSVADPNSDSASASDSDSDDATVPEEPDCPLPEMPELPPSSGDIGVPEELVPYLFSVYNFLRSFSLRLFLSPFSLDDFVGALNCSYQNTLLDAVHASLMRALKRHLEALSSEVSVPAKKCLSHYDWTLLDPLTWPVFLVEYLYFMGYMKKIDEGEFSKFIAGKEYYTLPVATKLKILQILCDEIVDSAELREELEMRENMKEEKECDVANIVPPESTPMRVLSRNSKTFARKNGEAMAAFAEPDKMSTGVEVTKPDEAAMDSTPDGNSDDCCICGMDGTLICCDGCPSAYHSRCIGLNKMLLPEGLWFCPECSVNKLGQTASRIGRGVRGAEVFGIDSYGRMFLGTCNYLLVIGTLVNAEPLYRYYNQDDVNKVLSIICSKEESLPAYVGICGGISKYWEIPLINTPSGKTESITNIQLDNRGYVPPSLVAVQGSTDNFNDIEGEDHMNNITESSADNQESLSQNNGHVGLKVEGAAVDLVGQANLQNSKNYDMGSHATSTTIESGDDATRTVENNLPFLHSNSINLAANGSVVTHLSNHSQPISAEGSAADFVPHASGNAIDVHREDAGSVFSKKSDSVGTSGDSNKRMHMRIEKFRTSEKNSCTLSSFKPQAYVNRYILGDIAASAAANLAVLAAEEGRAPETLVHSNPRKAAAAAAALQMKAFSGSAMHFLWPSYDKKLMEVPRERCGWCMGCRSTYRRACFLNSAAANAMKVSARNFLRPIKYNGSHLPAIGAHVGNMEETLHGLVIGPFLDAGYTQQWRKQAREACSFGILKFLLLQLENNIRGIVFSGDWNKQVDDWSIEFSAAPTSVTRSGPNQKRVPGRRSKKKSSASELNPESMSKSEKEVRWWRGGNLSKTVFQKGALPSSLAKKAGRQGGRKKVPGITYLEGSEFPRRTLQLAWRAAVEMSKNASQLAHQVRFLDAHIRWRDIVGPDLSSSEGKGSDFDSVFRNAVICDKRIAEDNIEYALLFTNQKHLPLRVMKNVLEADSIQGENEKKWFTEKHIPLYLIKEYEQKDAEKSLPSMATMSHNLLRSLRKPKSRLKDVFSYLVIKLDKPSKGPCSSCQGDLFLRDAVQCNKCLGFCHKKCTIRSNVNKEDDLEFLLTCISCYTKSSRDANLQNVASNVQMPLQVQNQHKPGVKCRLKIGDPQPASLVGDGLRFKLAAKPVMLSKTSGGQMPSQGHVAQLASMRPKLQVGPHQAAKGQGARMVTMRSTLQVRQYRTEQSYKMEDHPEMSSESDMLLSSESDSNLKHRAKREGKSHKSKRNRGNYGLIWKKPNIDESGESFRLENILLKSKDGTHPSRTPTCILCKTSYSPDLMYINCQYCPNWFHADAFKLEEHQIFDLIGFKCPKCRKIGSPLCPHSEQNRKKRKTDPLEQRITRTNEKAVYKRSKFADFSTHVSQQEMEDVVEVDNYSFDSFGELDPFNEIAELEIQTNGSASVLQQQQKFLNEADNVRASKFEVEDLVIADHDPLLPIGRVEPIEPVLEFHGQQNGSGAVFQGQQKLSVRRAQVKHEMSDEVFYHTEDAYSRTPTFSQNLQNPSVTGYDDVRNDAKDFSGIEDANLMGVPYNACNDQDGWDYFDTYGFDDGDVDYSYFEDQQHFPGDMSFENMEYVPQTIQPGCQGDVNIETQTIEPGDVNIETQTIEPGCQGDVNIETQTIEPGCQGDVNIGTPTIEPGDVNIDPQTIEPDCQVDVNTENRGFEPQTYFSFIELLASEEEIDDHYGMRSVRPPTGYIDLGTIDVAATEEPAVDGVVCDKCKMHGPSPDLTCEICGMRIHSYCSPWIEVNQPSEGTQWRCGSCKEWR